MLSSSTASALQSLMPLIVLALAAIVVMLVIGFYRDLLITAALSLLGLALALASLPWASAAEAAPVPLFSLDALAFFYMSLLFAACLIVVVLSYGYMRRRIGEREEFFVLLLLATFGAAVVVASSHFASFFLGLEVLSVSLYALIAYTRLRAWSIEAGTKYLVLASTSAAILLMGTALIYAELGTMDFAQMSTAVARGAGSTPTFLAGTALLVAGIGFKLAVVPFHMWTPDVYEGAPAPVTAFVATISKGAIFALMLRYFSMVPPSGSIFLVFVIVAAASMLAGNLLALYQKNVKRMLAYSSIAHLGYLLVAFLVGGSVAIATASFYLVAYFLASLGAFGTVSVLSGSEHDADARDQYRGLAWRQPYLAGVLAIALLSLAGLPLTGGFIAKFYVVMSGIGAAGSRADSSAWMFLLLVALLVVGSAIALFYYLRLVALLFERAVPSSVGQPPSSNWATAVTLGALTLALVGLGIYPGPLLDLIATTAAGFP